MKETRKTIAAVNYIKRHTKRMTNTRDMQALKLEKRNASCTKE